jgi:hypothetical protein
MYHEKKNQQAVLLKTQAACGGKTEKSYSYIIKASI